MVLVLDQDDNCQADTLITGMVPYFPNCYASWFLMC